MLSQIKNRERVRNHGEVFTNQREVDAMLDLVKGEAAAIDSTFMEPACGNGNFLVEILHRKLRSVFQLANNNSAEAEFLATRAFASIYGVDVQQDNVFEARERLFNNFFASFINHYRHKPSQICLDSVRFILSQNIQCGDTLACKTAEGTPLFITQWLFDKHDCLTIRIFDLKTMFNTGCSCEPVYTLPRIPYLLLPAVVQH